VPRRRARLLPWLAVYFTLALCLLARLPYQDALRSLAGDGASGLALPATTALTAARRRLGERPLELLFLRVAGQLMPSRDPWARVGGLQVTAWDGTTLKALTAPPWPTPAGGDLPHLREARGRERGVAALARLKGRPRVTSMLIGAHRLNQFEAGYWHC
jgi:hypothetical protein